MAETTRRKGRPPKPKESPGLLPQSHHNEEDFKDFLGADLKARRELTGALAGGRPLNVRKLVARFGGPTMLHQRLIARGFSVTIKAIEKWRERGRMSTDWLNELFVMSAEEGRPLLLENYIIGFPKETMADLAKFYRNGNSSATNKLRAQAIDSADLEGESLLG